MHMAPFGPGQDADDNIRNKYVSEHICWASQNKIAHDKVQLLSYKNHAEEHIFLHHDCLLCSSFHFDSCHTWYERDLNKLIDVCRSEWREEVTVRTRECIEAEHVLRRTSTRQEWGEKKKELVYKSTHRGDNKIQRKHVILQVPAHSL